MPDDDKPTNRNGQTPNHTNDDGWDSFDFETWGIDSSSANGSDGVLADVNNQRNQYGDQRRSAIHSIDDESGGEQPEQGGWVSQGGILRWQEPGDDESETPRDARAEARSLWASDAVDLPPGAPDSLRLRSLRAWLLRQRLLETEAMGQLLLERRQQEQLDGRNDNDEAPALDDTSNTSLELALAEQQAAIEVYEALVESLDEMTTHSGPARVLVEYYLWLNERLAILASAPEAPADFAERLMLAPLDDGEGHANTRQGPPPTPRSIAEWHGRTQAALQARRRIEQVTTPEPED